MSAAATMMPPPIKRSAAVAGATDLSDAADATTTTTNNVPVGFSTPPRIKRERANDPSAVAPDDLVVVAPADAVPAADVEPAPEPPNGMALGVTTVHPLQHFIPLCFKTDETLTTPWTKPLLLSTPGTPTATLVMLMLDLSPSMAGTTWQQDIFGGDPKSAAHAVVGMLKALPAYLKATLSPAQFAATSLAIAGFSGTAAWVDQNHCKFESTFVHRSSGNWVDGAHIDKINAQVVAISDTDALTSYLDKWVAKTERIYVPSTQVRDQGRGTNLQAALFFAHKVVEEYCNVHGGTAQVFVATDGQPTAGETSSAAIRRTVDETLFDSKRGHAVPIQMHALMMGNDVQPKVLTDVLGSRGLLGYAKDPDSIAAGLDSIFKIPFAEGKGSLDMATFVSFEDVATGMRVSELELTLYSQGQLVGDNYTALYGARVPDKFRSPGATCPTEADAAKLVVRVVGLCAPDLVHTITTLKQTRTITSEQLLIELLDQGHEVLIDKRLPLALDKWWAPAALRGPMGRHLNRPDVDQTTGQEQIGFGWDIRCCSHKAKETSSGSLYCWIEKGNKLLEQINVALGASQTSAQAREASDRYARMATSSGHSRLSRRMHATREASQNAAQAEDDLYEQLASQSQTPNDPQSQAEFRSAVVQRLGSAAHRATACLSQTPSHSHSHSYVQDTPANMSIDTPMVADTDANTNNTGNNNDDDDDTGALPAYVPSHTLLAPASTRRATTTS